MCFWMSSIFEYYIEGWRWSTLTKEINITCLFITHRGRNETEMETPSPVTSHTKSTIPTKRYKFFLGSATSTWKARAKQTMCFWMSSIFEYYIEGWRWSTLTKEINITCLFITHRGRNETEMETPSPVNLNYLGTVQIPLRAWFSFKTFTLLIWLFGVYRVSGCCFSHIIIIIIIIIIYKWLLKRKKCYNIVSTTLFRELLHSLIRRLNTPVFKKD